jgi:predicted nucleic acid-binding protein
MARLARQDIEDELAVIATTAREHDLTLVPRNVAGFRDFDLRIMNPWQ